MTNFAPLFVLAPNLYLDELIIRLRRIIRV